MPGAKTDFLLGVKGAVAAFETGIIKKADALLSGKRPGVFGR